jgi:hypothetical protein
MADKIVDHDGMMLHEFNNVVSDLGNKTRMEMKELKAELGALVVAKVFAQEKEIREVRDMVLSLSKKVEEGRTVPLPPLPTARKVRTECKGPQAPSYAQAEAAKNNDCPSRSPLGPQGVSAETETRAARRCGNTTTSDPQHHPGLSTDGKGGVQRAELECEQAWSPTIPLPSSLPPVASTAAEDETAGQSKRKEGGEGLDVSQCKFPVPLILSP